MEQQMTSEKQMTVHWHISADFPPLLQQRIIFPMRLFPWWLLDFSFLLLLFPFGSGFRRIQPWHIFANPYTCLSSWQLVNQSRGPSLQTSIIGNRHADDNKKECVHMWMFFFFFFFVLLMWRPNSQKGWGWLESGMDKDLGLYKEERKGENIHITWSFYFIHWAVSVSYATWRKCLWEAFGQVASFSLRASLLISPSPW